MAKTMTRADDDALLDMIVRRVNGEDTTQIAASLGMASSYVRTMTNRVKAADMGCGDRLDEIAKHYWWRGN